MSKVVTTKEDDDFLSSLTNENKVTDDLEDNFIFELKKLGIKYNNNHNFHLAMLNNFKDGTLNLNEVKKVFEMRYPKEIKAFKNRGRTL